ncbi:MAG: GNAT family N-acetyltransferase [Acidimicrobiales bacterium]
MERATSISKVAGPAALDEFRALVREYVASLPFSLEFQDLDRELAEAGTEYGPPGGAAYLAREAGAAVGCLGVRDLGHGIAELKRMFVRPSARGAGLGSALCAAGIAAARELGYCRVRLDTVAEMTTAVKIYTSCGFVPIPPYRDNPLESARYYELVLRARGVTT